MIYFFFTLCVHFVELPRESLTVTVKKQYASLVVDSETVSEYFTRLFRYLYKQID